MKFPTIRFAWRFSAPVILYDIMFEDFMRENIIKDNEYIPLASRGETVLLSPISLLWGIIYFLRFIISERFNHGTFVKCLYMAYVAGIVRSSRAKCVITFCDNNQFFHLVGRCFLNVSFIAIQNGVRINGTGLGGRKLDIDHLITFGAIEKKLFEEDGHIIRNHYPCGSLRFGLYREAAGFSAKQKFDICLVSQYRDVWVFNPDNDRKKYFKNSYDVLNRYIDKFQKVHGLSVCIAFSGNSQNEFNYYSKYFDKADVSFFENNVEKFSTYSLLDNSRLAITLDSSAAFEGYGAGTKLLTFLFSDKYKHDIYPDSIAMHNVSYEEFEQKILETLAIPQEEYDKLHQDNRRSFMNYDPQRPVHIVAQEIINEAIVNN